MSETLKEQYNGTDGWKGILKKRRRGLMGVRKGALNGEEVPKIRGNGGGMPMPYLFPSQLQSETFREHACINSRATPANRFCLIPSSDSRKRSLASQVPTLHSAQPRPEWTPLPGAPQTWNEVLCAMERNLPASQGGNSPTEENVLCSCFIHTRAALSCPGCCAAAAMGQGTHSPWRTALPPVSEQASSKQAPASTARLGADPAVKAHLPGEKHQPPCKSEENGTVGPCTQLRLPPLLKASPQRKSVPRTALLTSPCT